MATQDPIQVMNDAQEALDVSRDFVGVADQPWSEPLITNLSISVLIFVVVTLILCTVLLWRSNASAADTLKAFGIISIIGLSALLLIAGYSNDQLTPIVGLFGAIAGYLLGKETKT